MSSSAAKVSSTWGGGVQFAGKDSLQEQVVCRAVKRSVSVVSFWRLVSQRKALDVLEAWDKLGRLARLPRGAVGCVLAYLRPAAIMECRLLNRWFRDFIGGEGG